LRMVPFVGKFEVGELLPVFMARKVAVARIRRARGRRSRLVR